MTRPAEHLVHGAGPDSFALIDGRVAAWLERRAGLDDFRLKSRGVDPQVDESLRALHIVAERFRRGFAPATTDATSPVPDASSDQWIATSTAAARLHVTDQAVRKALREGRLKGEQREGRWWIHVEELAHFKERRTR